MPRSNPLNGENGPADVRGTVLLDEAGRIVASTSPGELRPGWLRAGAGVNHIARRLAAEGEFGEPELGLILAGDVCALVVPGELGCVVAFLDGAGQTEEQ